MKKHLVLSFKSEFERIVVGETKYLLRFFKKRRDFLKELQSGDLVFLKVGKEILGQFIIGKVIVVENFQEEDLDWIRKIIGEGDVLEKVNSGNFLHKNSIALIVKIEKIEQLITSPIEIPIVRKDWVILED